MASIPLRNYLREIEGYIDTGLSDEAIAHCRHILSKYPKNISSYRLLGKAHLESERYGDAADIFQRVLSAMPDDFVSHVGMSIIREDERNMDASIWHMERAFEAQPANPAIQDELRRLYGRRDGLEPPKIRLTRGALARMYANGNLYDQAISELRNALTDDPRRPDLLVLLARMYFLAGQRVESVETSSNLIKSFPYCLEANRILAIILPDVNREDDAQVYQQRVLALDPYFIKADPHALSSNDVPDNAVIIEHLQIRPGDSSLPEQPAWATSLGLAVTEKSIEEIPDWLTAESETAYSQQGIESEIAHVSPFTDEGQGIELTQESDQYIPDWMKSAGWEPATGDNIEGQGIPDFDEDIPNQAEENIVDADIPDWLKAIAPAGILATESQENIFGTGDNEAVPFSDDSPRTPVDTSTEHQEEYIEPTALSADIGASQSQSVPAESIPDLPDWLKEEQDTSTNIETSSLNKSESEIELPDWLKETEEPVTPSQALDSEWIKETDLEDISALGAAAIVSSQIPEWLSDEEELGTQSKENMAVQQDISQQSTEVFPQESTEGLETLTDETLISSIPSQPEAPITQDNMYDEAAALAWLESLAAKQGVAEEELITKPEDRIDEPPEWIKGETLSDDLSSDISLPETELVVEITEELEKPSTTTIETETGALAALGMMVAKDEFIEEEVTTPSVDLPVQSSELQDADMETSYSHPDIPTEIESQVEVDLSPQVSDIVKSSESDHVFKTVPSLHDEKDESALYMARLALQEDEPDQAVQQYNKLIQQKSNLDDIITDLQKALYKYPVDVNLWQALGDAYIRNNQLDQALEAYNKAEELLR